MRVLKICLDVHVCLSVMRNNTCIVLPATRANCMKNNVGEKTNDKTEQKKKEPEGAEKRMSQNSVQGMS